MWWINFIGIDSLNYVNPVNVIPLVHLSLDFEEKVKNMELFGIT